MKTSRRLAASSLSVIALTVGLITGVGVVPASAATVQVTVNNITYTADSASQAAGATVTSYSGAGGAVAIESSVTISGVTYAVTAIGNNAFVFKSLTAVTIPSTVTSIGTYAFADNSLQTVAIPSGVTAISNGAFYNNLLSMVSIPDAVSIIGNDAFYRNRLTSVTLPSALTTIGNSAFRSNLMTTVTIPSTVTTIGQSAFDDSLTTALFLGPAPTITAAGTYGSFGSYTGKTLYYMYANAASFGTVAWSGYNIAVLGTPFTTTTTPSISGTAKVGQTLTAYMSQWWTWSPIPTSVTYAWTRSGSSEVLGTDETYQPTAADVGSTLVVTITAERFGYASTSVTAQTTAVALGTFETSPASQLLGAPQVGGLVFHALGNWPKDATLAYEWRRVGSDTILATTRSYTAVASDLGKYLTVTVTASLEGYSDATVTSAPSAAVAAGDLGTPVTPTITGTAKVGQTLTASTGTWASGATFTYSWKRAGTTTPVGTASTYKAVAADVGKALSVTVTATRAGYTTATTPAATTTAVLALPFTTSSTPTISSTTTTTGSKLTAVTGTWNPSASVTYTYVWSRATGINGVLTPISGAKSKTYTLVAADKGKYLTVTVTATLSGYVTTSKTSVRKLMSN